MEKEREIELKSVIEQPKYESLIIHFSAIAVAGQKYRQTNYYFDTADQLLQKNKITLRLRLKQGKLQITAKLPNKAKGKYSDNEELNAFIPGQPSDYFEKGLTSEIPFIKQLLTQLDFKKNLQFKYLGCLETDRIDFKLKEDIISLDHSFYNGIEDYEVEWETKKVKKVASEFEKLNLVAGNSVSKFKRFLKSIAK